jgi:hypothetical protein
MTIAGVDVQGDPLERHRPVRIRDPLAMGSERVGATVRPTAVGEDQEKAIAIRDGGDQGNHEGGSGSLSCSVRAKGNAAAGWTLESGLPL